MIREQILVVDDDQEDKLILQEYFDDAGIGENVKYFENGEAVVTYLEEASENQLPSLVVLDLNMPIMNGTQTLLYLKRDMRYKHIPVIIFSTSENEEEKRKCISYGAIDYLVKPMTYDEGTDIVTRFASYLNVPK